MFVRDAHSKADVFIHIRDPRSPITCRVLLHPELKHKKTQSRPDKGKELQSRCRVFHSGRPTCSSYPGSPSLKLNLGWFSLNLGISQPGSSAAAVVAARGDAVDCRGAYSGTEALAAAAKSGARVRQFRECTRPIPWTESVSPGNGHFSLSHGVQPKGRATVSQFRECTLRIP